MENRPTYAYIPPNLNSTGGLLGGALDTRRVIEGFIGAGFVAALYLIVYTLIPSFIVTYISFAVGILVFAVCLIGMNGEPFSVFLLNIINYENRRIFVTLRPPMPDVMNRGRASIDEESDGSLASNKLVKLLRGDKDGGED